MRARKGYYLGKSIYAQLEGSLSESTRRMVAHKSFPWDLIAPALDQVPAQNQKEFLSSVIYQFANLLPESDLSEEAFKQRVDNLAHTMETHKRFWSVNGKSSEEDGKTTTATAQAIEMDKGTRAWQFRLVFVALVLLLVLLLLLAWAWWW